LTKPHRLVMSAVLLAGGLTAWYFVNHGETARGATQPAAPSEIPVTEATVAAKDVPIYLRALGTVQANYTVTVRTRVDGQVMTAPFQQGQEVKAGDLLFQIDPRPFQAALDLAQGNLQKDQSTLQGAQTDLARFAKLVTPGYQTQQAYDDEKATVGQLQGQVKADQAQIDTAKLNLEYAAVRAPFGDRADTLLFGHGSLVHAAAATSLVSITQLQPVFVDFPVPQDSFDQIRSAQAKAALQVRAYAGDDKTLLSQGDLSLINNQIDTTTGTIQLKGTFANTDEKLWPGEFISVHLVLETRKGVATVPASAVLEGPDGSYTYVIQPDNTVHRVDLQVGPVQDGLAIIDKGLTAGQNVVLQGQYRLTDGAKVKVDTTPPSS
jgi:membrane fusion protein, multidrug efflux system